ncbi:Avirulence (Avh) protein [Phytophthora megakarya]|uniref:Avirulence (Avh) protein n=1 Tax=Phytophthora megakarya TaxID=4795 RepID=A0A225UY14_9STRA|nr:Avirulence (Avh) protein [Phytophthora megakarya]
MGLLSIAVLGVTIFLTGSFVGHVASKITESTYAISDREFNQNGVEHTRLLRVSRSAGKYDEERSITDVYTLARIKWNASKLGKDIEAALKSSKLGEIRGYAETFNKGKIPSKQFSVVGKLMAKYGDDVVLQAVFRAKQLDDTKDVATKLETELFTGWMNNKQFADEVFSTLRIHTEESRVLRIEKIKVLDNYIGFLNAKTGKQNKLFDVLTTGFGNEDKVFAILSVAKTDPSTAKVAREMETTIFGEMVGTRLSMEGGLNGLMSDRVLRRMDDYVWKLRTEHKNDDISLIGVLLAKYGDENFVKALGQAKKVDATKELATNLQTRYSLHTWLKEGKSVDEVFKLLKLDGSIEALLTNRVWSTLEDYAKLYNHQNSAHESFIKTISKHFGGDSAFAIQLARFKEVEATSEEARWLQVKLFRQWKSEGLESGAILNTIFNVPKTEVTTNKAILRTAEEFEDFLALSGTKVNTA